MSNKILFVDDDPKLLKGITRQLDDDYDLDTALGPEEGLELVAEEGPYSVVVSDMRMPVMNGVEFLAKVREIHPDSVRIILTGFADLNSTIQAVNEGNIFRFLAKPVSSEDLTSALQAGIRQFELVTAEKALVEGTLKGSVKVLSEVLGLVNPTAFGCAARVQRVVGALAKELAIENPWELEIAAMLYPLGYVTVPDQTLQKISSGLALTDEERQSYDRHPTVAKGLLRNIPRLESVADIIAGQSNMAAAIENTAATDSIRLGRQILKIALDYDAEEVVSGDAQVAIEELQQKSGAYDARVLEAMASIVANHTDQSTREVSVAQLREGMVLGKDVLDAQGNLLVAKGHEVSASLKERLQNFAAAGRVEGSIHIEMEDQPQEQLFQQS